MKTFREQFIECSEKGYTKDRGTFFSFEEHPEMIPFCPAKAKAMLESGCKGIQAIACGRFGGDCQSGKPECQELRKKVDTNTKPS